MTDTSFLALAIVEAGIYEISYVVALNGEEKSFDAFTMTVFDCSTAVISPNLPTLASGEPKYF